MVQTEIEQMSREQSSRMKQQGIDLEQYLQYVGQTMDDFKKSMEPVATVRVKSNLVVEEVAKALSIEATAEDIDAELEKIASQYGMKKDDLASRIAGNDDFIRDSVIGRKTVEAIASAAKKVDAHAHDDADHSHGKKAESKKSAVKSENKKADAKKKSEKSEADA
jgi:trigger factor